MKNKYQIDGSVAIIYMQRRDGTKITTVVDADDIAVLDTLEGQFYAKLDKVLNQFYVAINIKEEGKMKLKRLHRLITNCPEGKVIDHINHDTLDNRRSNLRIVTQGQNNQNVQGARSNNNSSKLRNIDFKDGKWRVRINVNGKSVYVGSFKELEEAKIASEKARAKYMPYSRDADIIKLCDDEQVLPDPNKAHITNKHSKIKNVHWNKSANSWSVVIAKKYYGSFKELVDAAKKAEEIRSTLK